MRIVLSSHAQQRAQERQITFKEIKNIIENCDIKTPTRHRRRIRVMKKIGERTITVIYEQKDGYFFVITCAKTQKEGE